MARQDAVPLIASALSAGLLLVFVIFMCVMLIVPNPDFNGGPFVGLFMLAFAIICSGLLSNWWARFNNRQIEHVSALLSQPKFMQRLSQAKQADWLALDPAGLQLKRYKGWTDDFWQKYKTFPAQYCLVRTYVECAVHYKFAPYLDDRRRVSLAYWTGISLVPLTLLFVCLFRDPSRSGPSGDLDPVNQIASGLGIFASIGFILLVILDCFARSKTYAVLCGLALVLEEQRPAEAEPRR